jgi:tetratricopeptide (TPR) repeat protein
MFEFYTESGRQTVFFAKQEASGFGSPEISTEHILLGLLRDIDLTKRIMANVSPEEIRREVLAHRSPGGVSAAGDLPLGEESKKVLRFASEEAAQLRDRYVGNEHILLGLLRLESSFAARLLVEKGLSADKLRLQISTLQSQGKAAEGVSSDIQAAKVLAPESESKADLDQLKNAVRQSTELWKKGEQQGALKLLDDLIVNAKLRKSGIWVKILAMHASTLLHSAGDLESARRYSEQVLLYEPGNALALFTVADILLQQGKRDEAKEYAAKSYALVVASDTKEGRGLAELLTLRWPEIGESRV